MLLLLTTLIFLAYGHVINGPFVFDDISNIRDNPNIQLQEFSLEKIRQAAFQGHYSSRPVANISFAINYYFHKLTSSTFRLTNFAIHLMVGILYFCFLSITLQLPINRLKVRNPDEIAFFATLIWFIHPLHVQSVTYVIQRMNSLATLFYLLSFHCYLKARLTDSEKIRWGMAMAGILTFILAIGSKEIALTLPAFILLYEWFFFQDLDRAWLRARLKGLAVVAAVSILIMLLYFGQSAFERIIFSYAQRDFTLWQRLLTETRVILHYIDLFFWPHPARLSLIHEFQLSTSAWSPLTTLPAFIVLNGFVVAAVVLAKKQRLLSFCLLWFFGNLVIESSFIGLEIIYEYRTYLPSMMLCLAIIIMLRRLIGHLAVSRIFFAMTILVFSFWTFQRNGVWVNEVALWQDCLQKNPYEMRVNNNLGRALYEKGAIDLAIRRYQEAIRINPEFVPAYNNLGLALLDKGDIEQAIANFENAITIEPKLADSHYNLAMAFGELGYFDDAVRHYEMAEELEAGDDHDIHNNLGIILVKSGNIEAAIKHFKEALLANPADPMAHNNLGITYARIGENKEAIIHLQASLAKRRDDPVVHNILGRVLFLDKQYQQAAAHFYAALDIDPGNLQARNNLQSLERMAALSSPAKAGSFRGVHPLEDGDVSGYSSAEKPVASGTGNVRK